MKVGDLVTVKHINAIGVVVSTLTGDGNYYDVYLGASQKIVFCHTKELELINETR